jgi:hypothetical protein
MNSRIELSDNHTRSLAVTSRHIDKGIRELEAILSDENHDTSVLTTVKNLTPEKRKAILELLKTLKVRNEKLIKDFNLPAEQMYEDRIVRGKISMMWVLLSDSTSRGLKGYGDMPAEQAKILDEHIESLLEIIYKLQQI